MTIWEHFLNRIMYAAEGSESGAATEGETGAAESSAEGEGSPPATDSTAEGAAGEGGAAGVATAPAASPSESKTDEQKPDWRDRRIAQLTARLRAEQAKATPGAAPAATETPAVATPEAEIDRRANEKAAQIAAAAEFNRRCDDTANMGRKEFGDIQFNARVNGLVQLIDRQDPASVQTYNQFLEAAMETGIGAKIIHDLGGDLNRASEILSLPPVKMAMEIAKLAAAPTSQESKAPKPITPVGGRPKNETIDPRDAERADHLDMKTWMERREKQVNEGRRR